MGFWEFSLDLWDFVNCGGGTIAQIYGMPHPEGRFGVKLQFQDIPTAPCPSSPSGMLPVLEIPIPPQCSNPELTAEHRRMRNSMGIPWEFRDSCCASRLGAGVFRLRLPCGMGREHIP